LGFLSYLKPDHHQLVTGVLLLHSDAANPGMTRLKNRRFCKWLAQIVSLAHDLNSN
jgi:hypothetical protein